MTATAFKTTEVYNILPTLQTVSNEELKEIFENAKKQAVKSQNALEMFATRRTEYFRKGSSKKGWTDNKTVGILSAQVNDWLDLAAACRKEGHARFVDGRYVKSEKAA